MLGHYREFARDAPPECCVWADNMTAPPLPFLPEEVHGSTVLVLMQSYAGDLEEGENVLESLRGYGDPIADVVAPVPDTAAQSTFDDLLTPGARNYWKSHNYTELTDETLDTIVEYTERLPTPQSEVLIHHVGGAISDVASDATAYPHRDVEFIVTPGARWEDPTKDDECIAWTRECHDALADDATGGTYVNFEGEREGQEQNAYGKNHDRLVGLKNEYDPTNLFRMNQNIEPTV